MLCAPEFTISVEHPDGGTPAYEVQLTGKPQESDISDIACQGFMIARMEQNQILHDELDIDDTATIVLDVE